MAATVGAMEAMEAEVMEQPKAGLAAAELCSCTDRMACTMDRGS